MAIDEPSRLHLYEQARAALDDAAADTLMTALPRDPDRFATKDDIALVRADLATVEANLRGEIRATNSELHATRNELRGEIQATDKGLRGEIQASRHELRAEFQSAVSDLQRTLFFGMLASNATLVGLVFAAARLA